jgi:MtfA peptidase
VMQREFDALQARLSRGEQGLINAYGATEPAEFFAVVSEVFFEQGPALQREHPLLYQELSAYFGVASADWH